MKKQYTSPCTKVVKIHTNAVLTSTSLTTEDPTVEVQSEEWDYEFSSRKGRNSIWDDEE